MNVNQKFQSNFVNIFRNRDLNRKNVEVRHENCRKWEHSTSQTAFTSTTTFTRRINLIERFKKYST
jgi:hypothetical protein